MNPTSFEEIGIGSRIETPRFCTVRISALFENEADARDAGYKEPTHYMMFLTKSLVSQ